MAILGMLVGAAAAAAGPPAGIDPVTIHVFHDDVIHFTPDDPGRYETPTVRAEDNGREIVRTVRADPPPGPFRILARVATHPIPKDVQSVHDKWDRAGDVRLAVAGAPDVEVVKFVTAYGGATEHEVDVTRLAPLLKGECTFRGFVDTWVSPAWRMDFEIVFEPLPVEEPPEWMAEWTEGEETRPPDWARPLLYEPELTRESVADGPRTVDVEIPDGTRRVILRYLSSGHCTDGRDADEFVTKDNVILVDGREAHRLRPWRSDCRHFRDRNPYCRRWFDGSWSSDYDRSGWCPGDVVEPAEIDLTESLPPGAHTVGFRVDDIRPVDESGHGYWRVSAYLVGWVE